MPASYSYIDVATLDPVRERFATGDALAILSADLDFVIWVNGPGAEFFGHEDIGAALGASSRLGFAAKRQIAATSGFPDLGGERPLVIRIAAGMTSRAAALLASTVVLPDGEKAILLAAPTGPPRSLDRLDQAQRAISGFSEPGQFTAMIRGDGTLEAASQGFEALGIPEAALAGLAAEGRGERDRIVRRAIRAQGRSLPAGLARLTDDPARFLLVVVDEAAEDTEVAATPDSSGEVQPAEAAIASDYAMGSGDSHEAESTGGPPETAQTPPVPETTQDNQPQQHDEWYFSGGGKTPESPPVREGARETARPAIDRAAAPVRFVWRTDAGGRFSMVSPEFTRAVGQPAADVVGRSFAEISSAFRLDPDGEIAALLERRDTWSGRSVLWPIADTDLRVPVDLAALPAYTRDRTFEGFRGFGVARMADAIVDGDAVGLALSGAFAAAREPDAGQQVAEVQPEASEADGHTDPFKGEVPVLTIVPKPERRFTDKVIRLAEHRPPQNDKGLSSVERIAFREIGERLRRDSATGDIEKPDGESAAAVPAGTSAAPAADEAPAPETPQAETPAIPAADAQPAAGTPVVGQIASVSDEAPSLVEEGSDPETLDDLAALDGIDGAAARAADDETPDGASDPAASSNDKPAAEPAVRPRRGASLLDFMERPSGRAAESVGPSAEEPDRPVATAPAPPLSSGPEPEAYEDAETAAYAEAETAAHGGDTEARLTEAVVAEQPPPAAPPSSPDRLPLDADGGTSADVEPTTAGHVDTSILDKLPVPVLIHAGDALHHANDEFLALSGYGTLDEIEAAGGLGALFAASDEDHLEGSDRQMRLTRRDGSDVPVEAHLRSVPWASGKALMLVVTPQSVPAREAPQPNQPAVSDLQARIAEMRTIIDTATDGVVLIDRDGVIRSISRPAEALFGFDSDEVAGKQFASLFAIESQRAARDYLNGLSEHGVASVLNDGRELIGREAEGRFIPLFMTIGRLPGDGGFCAVVRDITQWKRAEEELTQARAMAERSSSQKSEFLARVSHEIRTPLNAIIGFSELMIDEKFGPVANDRYRDYLRDINRSGNHVLDLVNDLLDISKIEAGQQEMSYEAVSLNDTLAETVAMMQPQANRERVIIRSSFASRLPEVVADLRSVRQIALNILSNAVRYTQAGGQVIVSTAYESSGDVVMRVRDTGIGMSQAEIEQALKPFKQINALKRGRHDGTGLGLPLTKAMVEANRAKFSIVSTPGEGTLVEITFPSTRVLAD